MTPPHKDNMASPAQAPASEASPKGLVSTSPSCIWPQSIAASCGFWNKPQKQETAFYSEGREEDREPHFGFAHKSISTATNMFRIVDRKKSIYGFGGDGDNLFRNRYSFVSMLKIQCALSFRVGWKKTLWILEVMYPTWEVWKSAACLQRLLCLGRRHHSLVEVTIFHHLLFHVIFQAISYSFFSLVTCPKKLLSDIFLMRSMPAPATWDSPFP